jgi:hypothetical protein
MYLVDQIEHYQHCVIIDAKIVAQIADQPGPGHIYIGKIPAGLTSARP